MVSDETPKKTPKKRTGLFGGRAPKKAAEHAGSASRPDVLPTPEPEAVAEAPAEKPAEAPAESPVAEAPAKAKPARKAPAKKAPAQKADATKDDAAKADAAQDDVQADAAKAEGAGGAFPELKPESTTSLLFFAPPPEAVAPLRGGRGRDEEPESDEPSGSSRRRSRSRRGRGGASGDADGQRDDSRDDAREDSGRDGGRDGGSSRSRQRRQPEPITEPQRIKGSTRLEAKKQRRRDGRDAGRRRAVVTEAEFLARRESVDRVMVVRSKDNRIQIGVLEDEVLVEHYVARSSESSIIGNVYLGKVQNVLPSMEAAFVDIGRGRNAVLYSGEVDWDAAAEAGEKNQPRRIELALKPGDKVLVQVTKDPIGHKGARLTSQVSLPGRYLVYVPNGSMSGISRKLPDTERARLKKILKEVLPENVGVIVRTAAEGATEEQLTLDVERLTKQWSEISKQVEKAQAPAMLHSEPDLLVKIVRDVFNEDFRAMIIHGEDAHSTITGYLSSVAPDLLDRVQKHDGDVDPFDEHRINEQIEKALERKVWLPSGGSLVIDRTEAMTVVDVNTGKFVGSGGNLEETVTKNNLEAAEEIVRQLRLRDIGGIIVVDFIDMVLESNRDLVLRRLVECLSRDRTKHQVAEVTSLGLVQMTRKRLGLGLLETFSENCDVCAGRGLILHHDPVVKHRGNDGGGGGDSRRRGGSGGGRGGSGSSGGRGGSSGSQQKSGNGNGTHAITDDVSKALAAIAAKTVHHDAPATGAAEKTGVVKPISSGAGGSAASESGVTESGVVEPSPAAVEEAAAILDIPLTKKPERARPAIDPDAAQQLLGSVLESLPEPPAPGTRKRGSRRATTGTITAGTSEAERSGGDGAASGS
ncbi:Rne/Rng family ribonuclease [Chryseoglobus sp. 28M-23]|uniref:Rne/Rng family ribonuclease n=1 Tax=Chryseoglobus sp. 28M-23 TaxID=2772253 RepID=UPI001746A90D|nr:Rne/Rng family ribonuclease [Chryseoglobus sp. 28M-23]QOD92943.1 Rne/Rng family ribonuclease [Chryseoglobus sp. 28M-23]